MECANHSSTAMSSLSAPALINTLWAPHVQETRSYALLCEQLQPGGCTIHHSKRQPNPEDLPDRMTHTLERYHTEFDTDPPGKIWPCDATADPSAAAQADSSASLPSDIDRKRPFPGPDERHSTKAPRGAVDVSPITTQTATTQIFVRNLNWRVDTYHVDLNWTVSHVKCMVTLVTGIPVDEMRLCFAGRQLEDEQSLAHDGVLANATFHIILRLRAC